MPLMVLLDQEILPVGVRTPPSVSRRAMVPRVAPCSRYKANICRTIAASYSSTRKPAGSRGLSGSVRYPKGTRTQGRSCPERNFASRPRRILSAMSVLSYSATAPLICSKSWSLGSWLMGLSRNSTRAPAKACSQRGVDGLGSGVGQRGREGRLGEAVAARRLSGAAEAVGSRTHVFLDRPEQEDEQRLREAMCERRSVRICCHESPHDAAADPHLRPFHTVSLGTWVNKPSTDALGFAGWHHSFA